MQKLLRLLPYKFGSRSAKVITKALNGLRVRFDGKFRPKPRHLVVNWGSPRIPRWWTNGLNSPDIVAKSSNKLTALTTMKAAGVSIPEFTTDSAVAKQWFDDAKIVVGRRILTGSKGIGCIIYDKEESDVEPNDCPLYTKHLRHKREFRIHVFRGRIIDMVEKRKRRGFENRNAWIRNYNNGYVFCRNGFQIPESVKSEAIKATNALGLDFGAVDVAYREKENKAYVFEVNTAPGTEGQTIQTYVNAFREELNG